MKKKEQAPVESDLPKLSAPAWRALNGAGYLRLEQLALVSEGQIAALHGIGPSGIKALKEAMAKKGLSFKR